MRQAKRKRERSEKFAWYSCIMCRSRAPTSRCRVADRCTSASDRQSSSIDSRGAACPARISSAGKCGKLGDGAGDRRAEIGKEIHGENTGEEKQKDKNMKEERWESFSGRKREARMEIRRARSAEWKHEAERAVARSWLQVNLILDGSSSPLKYPVNRFQSSTPRPRSLADIRFSLLRPKHSSSPLSLSLFDPRSHPSSVLVYRFRAPHRPFSLSYVYPHRAQDKTKGH